MSIVKVKRIMFRYPEDMPEGDKRAISVKSGYLACSGLRNEHKVVYQNILKKNALGGAKNTTRSSMTEMGQKYPERYQELRVMAQKELVQAWCGLQGTTEKNRVRIVADSIVDQGGLTYPEIVTPEEEEYPRVRKSPGGFFSRLFRRGL